MGFLTFPQKQHATSSRREKECQHKAKRPFSHHKAENLCDFLQCAKISFQLIPVSSTERPSLLLQRPDVAVLLTAADNEIQKFSFKLALVKGENKRVNFYVIIKSNIDTRSFMLKALQQHLQQTHTDECTTRHKR